MNVASRYAATWLVLCLGPVACSAADGRTSTGSGASGSASPDAGPSGGDGGSTAPPGPVSSGACTSPDPNTDLDLDGFTTAQGDCNECSELINPGALDFAGNEYDEDCSGTPADAAEDAMGCDGASLAIGSTAAEDAARALGLCKFIRETDPGWGVLKARFTTANGGGVLEDPMMIGLLPAFGAAKPRAGASMLALSTGVARAPGQTGYTEDCDQFDTVCEPETGCEGGGIPPEGYPRESSECAAAGGGTGEEHAKSHNEAALELTIRAPTNANSLAFDSMFYTYEFPEFICDAYNDFFVVLKEPRPELVRDGNILFDAKGNPIGVNSGLLAVCDVAAQDPAAAKQFTCEQGTDLLRGTGYGPGESSCGSTSGGASTGWLRTTAPVSRGEVFTIRFAIWDTSDAILDSTALIDNFSWSVAKPEVETKPILL